MFMPLITHNLQDPDWHAQKEYEVEALLAKRQRDGVDEYLVSWLGWHAGWNSWEPTHFGAEQLTVLQ